MSSSLIEVGELYRDIAVVLSSGHHGARLAATQLQLKHEIQRCEVRLILGPCRY